MLSILETVTWRRNYKLLYYGSSTQVGVMSDKRPELSTKWRMSGKFFETSFNSKSAYIKVREYIWHWLCDSETISSYILEVLLSWLDVGWTPRYINIMTNLPKKFSGLQTMIKVYLDKDSSVFSALVTDS